MDDDVVQGAAKKALFWVRGRDWLQAVDCDVFSLDLFPVQFIASQRALPFISMLSSVRPILVCLQPTGHETATRRSSSRSDPKAG